MSTLKHQEIFTMLKVRMIIKESFLSKSIWKKKKKTTAFGISLVIQWLGHHTSTAEGLGFIPSGRTKISLRGEKIIKCNGILLFSLKNECSSNACYNML